jgi:cyclopropane-fatty-acyl-phospholipid synthase
MMHTLANLALTCTERGLLPDPVVRMGIRKLVRQRLAELQLQERERASDALQEFISGMDGAEIAPIPHMANEQHYEVPAEFFSRVLGAHRKYSSCYWRDGVDDLDQAEADALRVTCERARLQDGQHVLELGHGWGSLSLWMARNYPQSRITAVSNSASQRRFIEQQCAETGVINLQVITADMNGFSIDKRFDRVVSVEMFEHMRNYREIFRRVYSWLRPGGQFFMHIFCHRAQPYEFVDRGASDWMSRYFFSGGIMPSHDLPLHFQDDLHLVERHRWSGTHYEKTANAWLVNMDLNRNAIMPILAETYGREQADRWWMRWRVFFMACAELFGYRDGEEWWVSHYLFERPAGD